MPQNTQSWTVTIVKDIAMTAPVCALCSVVAVPSEVGSQEETGLKHQTRAATPPDELANR